jgi:hypothetical protein
VIRLDLHQARRSLENDGYVVLRQAVPPGAVAAALRLLGLAIRREGLTAEQIAAWQQATFFPHLRWEPALWEVLPDTAAELLGWQQGDDWAEPQILLRFPDEEQPWPLEPHVDTVPPWARGQRYRGIVGVALTDAGPQDGVACVWPGSHLGQQRPVTPVPLRAGDALVMHPLLGHCGTLNLGSTTRTAVYFRLITSAPVDEVEGARSAPTPAGR